MSAKCRAGRVKFVRAEIDGEGSAARARAAELGDKTEVGYKYALRALAAKRA
jgi:hypothetical protein